MTMVVLSVSIASLCVSYAPEDTSRRLGETAQNLAESTHQPL